MSVAYLRDASDGSLRNFALSRRNHAANLLKELRALYAQAIEDLAEAEAAMWIIEHRAELRAVCPCRIDVERLPEPLDQVDQAN